MTDHMNDTNDVIRWIEQFGQRSWVPVGPGGRVRPAKHPSGRTVVGRSRSARGEPRPSPGTGVVSIVSSGPSAERMHERRMQTLVQRMRDFELTNARRASIVLFVMRLWVEGHTIDNAIDVRVSQHRQPRALIARELLIGLRELMPSFAHIPAWEWRGVWFEITDRAGLA